MEAFKREERYFVSKLRDAEKYLSKNELKELTRLTAKIDHGRVSDDKHMMNCVVVEKDWPMYEDTWNAIEQFCNKESGPGTTANKRGKLEIFEGKTELLEKLSIESDDFGFLIKLKNGLHMIKASYGTSVQAERAGNIIAKFYEINVMPKQHSGGKGTSKNRQ